MSQFLFDNNRHDISDGRIDATLFSFCQFQFNLKQMNVFVLALRSQYMHYNDENFSLGLLNKSPCECTTFNTFCKVCHFKYRYICPFKRERERTKERIHINVSRFHNIFAINFYRQSNYNVYIMKMCAL